MTKDIPHHFSHKFELKIEKLPTKASDRLDMRILYPGLFFGAVLFFLGIYDLFNGFLSGTSAFDKLDTRAENGLYPPLLSPSLFDGVIMALGLGIIISLIFSNIKYKKIYFDGKMVEILNRPTFGMKKVYRENLANYDGVLLRIEFFQFGFLNKNKYIIELHHKNPKKTAPLYISTSDKDIRKKWKYYAKTLNQPALVETDEGLVKREVADLDKSLKEMAEIWGLKKDFKSKNKLPPYVAYTVKPDKIVIKARKIIWDAYNIIAWACVFFYALAAVAVSLNTSAFGSMFLWIFYSAGAAGIVVAVFLLFRKDKLVIKKDKIVNTHKYMLFSRKNDEMKKDDVAYVDVTLNPVTERYFVTISSDEKTMIFGKKLPTQSLRWVKNFVINEIVNED